MNVCILVFTPERKDKTNHINRHQRKARKIYISCYTERGFGTNLNDRKDSPQGSERKTDKCFYHPWQKVM